MNACANALFPKAMTFERLIDKARSNTSNAAPKSVGEPDHKSRGTQHGCVIASRRRASVTDGVGPICLIQTFAAEPDLETPRELRLGRRVIRF
jgi:hypothetical protein